MKHTVPVLFPTSAAESAGPGLTLRVRGPWIEGTLRVDGAAAGSPDAWLRDLHLLAVSEPNQTPRLARVVPQDVLLSPPAWKDGLLAFAAHASWLFGGPLYRQPYYLHGWSKDVVSPPLRFVPEELAIEGGRLPGDRLAFGYDLAFHGRPADALVELDVALSDRAVAADLDGAHAYNAACLAVRAGDLERALLALTADLSARAALHNRRSFAIAVAADDPTRDQRALDALLVDHVRHLRADPDLAPLRQVGAIERMLGAAALEGR